MSPTIEEAPRAAPSRSSASPNARASLISEAGSPRAAPTGPATGLPAQAPGMLTRNRVVAGGRVVQPRDPDPDRPDVGEALDGLRADGGEARDHGVRAVRGGRHDLPAIEGSPLGIVPRRDHPLDVRAAKVESEMSARRRAVPHVAQDSPVTRV